MAKCCGDGMKKEVMLFSCSCGANVGEVADHAARQLAAQGLGTMSSPSCIAAGIDAIIKKAAACDLNLVFDGCDTDCTRKALERVGVRNIAHVRITDLGVQKAKGARAADDQVARAVAKAKELMG